MTCIRLHVAACLIAATLVAATNIEASPGGDLPRTAPIPVEVLASDLNQHVAHLGVDLSPDGRWLARTYLDPGDAIESERKFFSSTGAITTLGASRLHVEIVDLSSGKRRSMGATGTSTWGPAWSPDSRRLAFYSDEGGEAGVAVWDVETSHVSRFQGVIARPRAPIMAIRWFPDSTRVVFKALPAGMTLAEANSRLPPSSNEPPPDQGAASQIRVLQAHVAKPSASPDPASPPANAAAASREIIGDGYWDVGDLVVLNTNDGAVQRVVQNAQIYTYELSPDATMLAYTTLQAVDNAAYQSYFDIGLYDFGRGAARKLAEAAPMSGLPLNWSPDGQRLTFFVQSQPHENDIAIISVAAGQLTIVGSDVPSFDVREGVAVPVWDHASQSVAAISGLSLWVVTLRGPAREYSDADHRIVDIIARPEEGENWSAVPEEMWVIAETRAGLSRLVRINRGDGAWTQVAEQAALYASSDVAEARERIAWVTVDAAYPADVSIIEGGRIERLPPLNPALGNYTLGSARMLRWRNEAGRPRGGALLLPPDYREGQRVPLVVWVYGGAYGSQAVNVFGLAGDTATYNMQVLATRGYAVLFPDAPLEGSTSPMTDIVGDVMPVVDAVIEAGIADPDRLAVMGTSFGSYNVLSLITQTNRFKAAIISAVMHPDLIAAYLSMERDGRPSNTGWFEVGQSRMGGTPWEQRERYIQNSPIFQFDRIETPVLVVQGDQDFLPVSFADSVYVALQRLGKEVQYVTYPGEGHVIQQPAHVLDFWDRRLRFLQEHLDLVADREGRVSPTAMRSVRQ